MEQIEALNVKERVIEKLFIFVKILYYNCPTHLLTTIQSESTSKHINEYRTLPCTVEYSSSRKCLNITMGRLDNLNVLLSRICSVAGNV